MSKIIVATTPTHPRSDGVEVPMKKYSSKISALNLHKAPKTLPPTKHNRCFASGLMAVSPNTLSRVALGFA
jgi:hypothetical protein